MPYTVVMSRKHGQKERKAIRKDLYTCFVVTTSTDGLVGELYVPKGLAPRSTANHLDCSITLHAGAA